MIYMPAFANTIMRRVQDEEYKKSLDLARLRKPHFRYNRSRMRGTTFVVVSFVPGSQDAFLSHGLVEMNLHHDYALHITLHALATEEQPAEDNN